MTTIEIFALIVVIVAAIKMIFALTSPKSWLNFTGKVWKFPTLMMWASLILAAIVLYYILQTLTIIDIFAVMLFIALLSATTMAVYARDFLSIIPKIVKDKKFLKKAWLPILIWLVLIIWAAKELFV